MDTLLAYVISGLVFTSFSLQVEPAKLRPQITVMGIVYCDICSNNTFSRNSYFLPGAEVKVDCRFEANSPKIKEEITFSVNTTTNKHGVYKIELPAVVGIKCARDKSIGNFCRGSLMGSSNALCNVPGYKTTADEVTIKSEQANLCIYSLNAMSFRPSKRDIALCGN